MQILIHVGSSFIKGPQESWAKYTVLYSLEWFYERTVFKWEMTRCYTIVKPYVQSSQEGVAFYKKKNCLVEMMARISNYIRNLTWDVITLPKGLT